MPNTPFGYILFTLFVLFYLCSCNQETPKPVCHDPRGCETIDPGEPIKIGVLPSLSGSTALFGLEQVRGFDWPCASGTVPWPGIPLPCKPKTPAAPRKEAPMQR